MVGCIELPCGFREARKLASYAQTGTVQALVTVYLSVQL